jgi:hypothetical protein
VVLTSEREEHVAEYLLERVREQAPHTWRQAARSREPSAAAGQLGPHARVFRDVRVLGISELAVRGLSLIGEGFPVELSQAPFSAEAVLALQARGARCVSLLPAGAATPPPHADGLAFVLHDLCHLAKFADPSHYVEQVGFFDAVERAFASEPWCAVERELDADWRAARSAVVSDMNGSCVFLFVQLKMKLKMAARRNLGVRRGVPARVSGVLDTDELAEFERLLEPLLDAFDFPSPVRAAALATSARRDSVEAATALATHFAERGRGVVLRER